MMEDGQKDNIFKGHFSKEIVLQMVPFSRTLEQTCARFSITLSNLFLT